MTEPTYTDPLVTLYLGDSLEVMRELPDESVDSVVTDPPYGLSSVPDITEVLTHWLAGDDYKHRGGGFMGRSWDSFVPGPVYWRECFRVLKPGGHLLCFASTRTVDLMGIAVRLAGFEPRDLLMHVFASGFPKSLDVSKALDKVAGVERERVMVPTKPGNHPDQAGPIALGATGMTDTSKPVSDLARKWEGWGTALKPAHEPIVMARKPLVGTVAANVTRYGTGALNIDGSRIGTTVETWPKSRAIPSQNNHMGYGETAPTETAPTGEAPAGRWPSNVLLSSPELFDEPNPWVVGSGAEARGSIGSGPRPAAGMFGPMNDHEYADTGGYSRFFRIPSPAACVHGIPFDRPCSLCLRDELREYPVAFCIPKADRAERERGLAGAPKEVVNITEGHGMGPINTSKKSDGGVRVNNPRANVHPTVKPIDLMRHLVRLVTPPGGVTLDPFAGSGTTGLAASEEGFRCILIEREAEYCEIIVGRLMATPMGLGLDVPIVGRRDIGKQRGNKDAEGRPTLEGPASLGSSWFHGKPDEEDAA